MSTTTLRIKQPAGVRIDASALAPTAVAGLSVDALARLMLPSGNGAFALGDLCEIHRDSGAGPANPGAKDDGQADDAAALVIEGDARHFDYLGKHMAQGRLTIDGSAGDYVAHQMTGGAIDVKGDAGMFTSCEMAGGTVTVRRNVGDFAGAALPGDMDGMTGGTLIVYGNAGARLADRMRRGLLLVCGDAGDFAASRLVAGTVGIAGRVGAHPVYGMRRGTLVLLQSGARLPPTVVEGGGGFGVFWAMLSRSFARYADTPFAALASRGPGLPHRFNGDLAVDGRGEILIVD